MPASPTSSRPGFLRRVVDGFWQPIRDFAGLTGDATYLWPRWLFLRAVGVVFIIAFAGIILHAQVFVGPHGLTPLGDKLAELRGQWGHGWEVVLRAPSLFWLSPGAGMIAAVAWAGMLAAVAVVLNLWPRMSLFVCWLCLLSFVSTWGLWSGSQVDRLMLETTLVCLAYAPAGFRPGLGAASPPRPIALFMLRWLLFRIMFENGIIKVISGDPRWRDWTAMDYLYETSPFPTILGYLDHQLSHAYHVFEVALTYAAEFPAPLLAVFAGRRGRWWALAIWTAFQAGIQLTNNFGWLNTAAIAMGLVLLDDQMLTAGVAKLRLRRLAAWLAARAVRLAPPPLARWRMAALQTALWTHFSLSVVVFVIFFGRAFAGFPLELTRPFGFVEGFHSVNAFTLFGGLLPARYGIEFEGSDDGGVTWRTYEYHYQPQDPKRICPFIAPCYARFEATLQIEATKSTPSPLYAAVATHLLQHDPAVTGLFRRDPFPAGGPRLVRLPAYQLTFTDLGTRRATGRYWHKELVGEYTPMMYLDAKGQGAAVTSSTDAIRLMAGQGNAQAQSALGLMYAQGENVPRDEVEALVWFTLAAHAGDADAARNRDYAASRVGRAGVQAARQRSEAIQATIDALKSRK